MKWSYWETATDIASDTGNKFWAGSSTLPDVLRSGLPIANCKSLCCLSHCINWRWEHSLATWSWEWCCSPSFNRITLFLCVGIRLACSLLMFFTYSAHQSRTPVSLMWNSWWNSAGKRMLRYSQLFNQCRFWFWGYQYRLYVVIEQPICYCSVVRLYLVILVLCLPLCSTLPDCWLACPCVLCPSPVTLIICVGEDILFHFEFCIYCSEFVQECTEFANPVRERVTKMDGKIHTWWLHSNFSTNQMWKGSSMHMQTSICSALRHRWTANCGFNPIQ